MPTYQYACTECGHGFETFQSFTEDALTECPACAGRLRKVFSSVGVVFKGSGFYRNDSREATKDKSGGATDGGAKDGGGKAAETKSDKPKGDSTPAAAGASSTSSSGSSSSGSSTPGSGSSTKGSAA